MDYLKMITDHLEIFGARMTVPSNLSHEVIDELTSLELIVDNFGYVPTELAHSVLEDELRRQDHVAEFGDDLGGE